MNGLIYLYTSLYTEICTNAIEVFYINIIRAYIYICYKRYKNIYKEKFNWEITALGHNDPKLFF